MKATGIVRRIDDLGRVVIPKEIRRTGVSARGRPAENNEDGFTNPSSQCPICQIACT